MLGLTPALVILDRVNKRTDVKPCVFIVFLWAIHGQAFGNGEILIFKSDPYKEGIKDTGIFYGMQIGQLLLKLSQI